MNISYTNYVNNGYYNFGKNINTEDKHTNSLNQTENDSIELSSSKQNNYNHLYLHIMSLLPIGVLHPKTIEENKICAENHTNFINNAKKKINAAKSEFQAFQQNSTNFYNEADTILQKLETDEQDKNIQVNSLQYKGGKYRTIIKSNTDGQVDKIIHIKDGKIRTIYDIKNSLNNDRSSLHSTKKHSNIKADCYFYNDDNIEFMKNISNSPIEFFASYDTENGGLKQVKRNSSKKTPVELYIKKQNNSNNFQCWFNYGKKNEEKVSFSDLGKEKTREKYTKKHSIGGILKEIKTFFHYNNIDGRQEYRLLIRHPKIGFQDYKWE